MTEVELAMKAHHNIVKSFLKTLYYLGLTTFSSYAFAADPLPNRPAFKLPFPCGTQIELKTYQGHSPDDKKIDMYRVGMFTGSPITASAAGVVHQTFSPGGIEIKHGNGWFTTYMHMSSHVSAGTQVKQGDVVGYMGDVGSPGIPHLHYEQLYAPGLNDAGNQHIVNSVLQGEWLYMVPNTPLMRTSSNCPNTTTPPSSTNKFWVDTWADTNGRSSPGGTVTGTLYKGTHYTYCKVWGPKVQNSTGTQWNHWWLKTDLDVGPTNQWVSAFMLSRWGNDEAKDNNGVVIPNCP